MHLELSSEDAKLLKIHLHRRVAELDDELVHTEKFELQEELAKDVERLRIIDERLGQAMAEAGVTET